MGKKTSLACLVDVQLLWFGLVHQHEDNHLSVPKSQSVEDTFV